MKNTSINLKLNINGMIKKSILLGFALLIAGQLLVAQSLKLITLSADGDETSYVISNVQKIIVENKTMTVEMKDGDDVTNITRISFDHDLSGSIYSNLRINEVSGVDRGGGRNGDNDKFYELINNGEVDIPLDGCQLFYNANGSPGLPLPTGEGTLTWTGDGTQVAEAGKLFSLIGRNNTGLFPGSFTSGLTPERILIITLKDPDGNVIDKFIRAEDTGKYATPDRDKSFSRIPDGTGPFYFTEPTPEEFNGTDATGLLLIPDDKTGIISVKVGTSIFVFPNPVKEYLTVNGVKKGAILNLYDLSGVLLQTVTAQDNSTNINVSTLQQGVYFLRVEDETIKFIKQ